MTEGLMIALELRDKELIERIIGLLEESILLKRYDAFVTIADLDNNQSDKSSSTDTDSHVSSEEEECRFKSILEMLLIEAGITKKYKAHMYMLTGCELIMQSGIYNFMITKDIYPELARLYNVTSTSVERAIRNVIDISWERECVFCSPSDNIFAGFNHKPSNGEMMRKLISAAQAIMNQKNNTDEMK